ncbi:MAG: diguanylate cyclase [Henriciella sp.]|jgi:PleD family two-component response regulator
MTLIDRRFDDPVIEVAAQSPRLEMLMTRLRHAGMRPIPVTTVAANSPDDPVLIDLATAPDAMPAAQTRLTITLGDTQANTKGDIHLSNINLLHTLPARMAIRKREQTRQREADRRTRTAQRLGLSTRQSATKAAPRLLWLGQNAAFLNPLKSALKSAGVDLVAALSRLTAEDYLAKGGFDAVIVYPSTAGDEASQLLARYVKADHAPKTKLVLLTSPETSASIETGRLDNVDQILDLINDPEKLSRELIAYAQRHTKTAPKTNRLTATIREQGTKLASRAFLEAHLETQIQDADASGERLCLIALNAPDAATLKRLSETIQPMLRETDLAARLDKDHICITMPATPYRGAVALARRIEASMDTDINWRVVERRRFHTLKTLLGGLTAKSHMSLAQKFG